MSAHISESQLVIVFGKSGAGKTFVGKQISKSIGFHFHDGDTDLTDEVREAIALKQPFTPEMRDRLYNHLADKVRELLIFNNNVVFSQALFKSEHRQLFSKLFPHAKFVWVDASDEVISRRLEMRKGHIASLEYAKKIRVRTHLIT